MRKGSKQSSEARKKMTESHYRRYSIRGGQTAETRQKIAETQRRRYAEAARLIAFARVVMRDGSIKESPVISATDDGAE